MRDFAASLAGYFSAVRAIYAEHGARSQYELKLEDSADSREMQSVEAAIGVTLDPRLETLWRMTRASGGAPLFQDGRFLNAYALVSPSEALVHRSMFEQRAQARTARAGLPNRRPPAREGRLVAYVPSGPHPPRDPRVGDGWFSPGWLPFAVEETGVGLLVDHRPLGTGEPGQVLRYAVGTDDLERVAGSIAELLALSREQIEGDALEFLGIF